MDFFKKRQADRAPTRDIRAREEVCAALGYGTWVPADDMNPMTNVADRLYRTEDGSVHRAIFFPLMDAPVAWFFPDFERLTNTADNSAHSASRQR